MHAGIIEDGSGVPTGTPLADPPLIEMISEDPVLRNTKLISEAWDCDGLFQVGARLIYPCAAIAGQSIFHLQTLRVSAPSAKCQCARYNPTCQLKRGRMRMACPLCILVAGTHYCRPLEANKV